jgi:hypothetical protein
LGAVRRLNPGLIMITRVLTGVAIGDGSLAVWDAVASLHLVPPIGLLEKWFQAVRMVIMFPSVFSNLNTNPYVANGIAGALVGAFVGGYLQR